MPAPVCYVYSSSPEMFINHLDMSVSMTSLNQTSLQHSHAFFKQLAPAEQRMQSALSALAKGQPIIVMDDFDRENEADLIVAAEKISVDSMARMIRDGSGIVCLYITDELANDLARPGHVFPLRAKAGGVLTRRGHTEASVDLAQLAGLKPAGVLCELMNPDGSMMQGQQIVDYAQAHQLVIISIEELVQYRTKLG